MKWTQLSQVNLLGGPPAWSKDGKCLYYQDLLASNEPLYCFHLGSKKQQTVVTFEQFLHGSVHRAGFIGLAPDGSPMAVLSRNDSDVYSLELDIP